MTFTPAELYADRSAVNLGLRNQKLHEASQRPHRSCFRSWVMRSTGSVRGVVQDMVDSTRDELNAVPEQPNARKSSGLEHRSEACIVRNRCPAVGRPERGTCLVTSVNSVLQRGGTPPSVLSATVGSVGCHPFLSRKLPHCPAPGRTRRRLRRTVGRFAPIRLRKPPRSLCGPPERPGRG